MLNVNIGAETLFALEDVIFGLKLKIALLGCLIICSYFSILPKGLGLFL